MGGGWSDKTKVILNSTQFKFKLVEVGVELGKRGEKVRGEGAVKITFNVGKLLYWIHNYWFN